MDCPIIPKNILLVAKKFKSGDKQKRRQDAVQEMLMGGLNHKGIVGALAMTVEDPPNLIYDYYNGGDLGSFVNKCGEWSNGKGKGFSTQGNFDAKFMRQQKLVLENRLGIACALLETMQFFHDQNRVHCDFHFGNILLHFGYDGDEPIKVYVGMCDFGMSKQLSQCHLKEHLMWATAPDKVRAYMK